MKVTKGGELSYIDRTLMVRAGENVPTLIPQPLKDECEEHSF